MKLGARFVVAARSMVGTPFHWHGRVPGKDGGLDCSGLIIKAAELVGVTFSFSGKYSRANQVQVIDKALKEHCRKLKSNAKYEAGDILVIEVKDGPGHLLIFAGETIIHASDSPMHQKVLEQPFGDGEREKVSAAYRLKERK